MMCMLPLCMTAAVYPKTKVLEGRNGERNVGKY